MATHVLSFEDEHPKVEGLSKKGKKAHVQTNEAELLAIELQIVEVLSKLSIATNEEEKQDLDTKFQQLLNEKKKLL